MRKFTEAKVSDKLAELLKAVSLKDWQRALNVDKGRVNAMLKAIKDPTKKVGRSVALYLLKKIDGKQLGDLLDDATITTASVGAVRSHQIYQKAAELYPNSLNSVDDFENYEYPEFDFSLIEDPDFVIEYLDGITFNELKSISPTFDTFVNEVGEDTVKATFAGSKSDMEDYARETYDWNKDTFQRKKTNALKKKQIVATFGGKPIFTYMEVEKAVSKMEDDPELKEYFEEEASKGNSFYKDSDHISPFPIMDYFDYVKNFSLWLKATYDIDATQKSYVKGSLWMSGHPLQNRVFEFKDDDSAANALALRKEPLFQDLITVTRNGIQLTSAGAKKVWYDFTKDIADAIGLTEFNCEEF